MTHLRWQSPICGFLRFSAKIFGFLRKSAVFCGFLRFPAPSKCLNFQEKGRICENLRFSAKIYILRVLCHLSSVTLSAPWQHVSGEQAKMIECFRGRHRRGGNFTSFLRFSRPSAFCLKTGTKIQPKEEVFGRTSLRTSRQKLRSGPPNPGKTSTSERTSHADVHEKNFGLKNFGLIFRSLLRLATPWREPRETLPDELPSQSPVVTRSRPQSEFQVINLFLCREGCGEVFGSCGGDKF